MRIFYYDDYDEDFDEDEDFMGAQSCKKSQRGIASKRFITIRVKNVAKDTGGNPIAAKATLFGSFGSPGSINTGVEVTMEENDYGAFLAETASSPYTIANPRFRVKNASQYANPFNIKEVQSTGQVKSYKVQPQNFENPANNNDKLIEMLGFGMIADGRSSLDFNLEAGEEVSLAFEVISRVNNSNLLKGKKASGGKKSCNCASRRGGRGRRNRRGGRGRRNRNRY